MEQTYEEIRKLYDTFLGRFRFFRQFIRILWNLASEIANINSMVEDFRTTTSELKVMVSNQNEVISAAVDTVRELSQTVKPPQPTDKTYRTASQIMEERFQAYQDTTVNS